MRLNLFNFVVMLILCLYYLFSIFILNVSTLRDEIANKIKNSITEHNIPLILKNKLIDNESGSMSSTYDGDFKSSNGSLISVIIKYSSFKSTWNYVHKSALNDLYETKCYSKVNENTNEYLISKQDKNRIINESFIPSEVYIAFKGYYCSHLMPTSTIVDPLYSYFSFFKSIDQSDDERTFILILKKLENGISLKRYVEVYSNNLTIEMTKYLIYSILISLLKLRDMSIIHLDLNSGNIFLMNNDNQHPIRFIDFAIITFIHQSSPHLNVMYSQNLHQSLQSIFRNCPSCYSIQLPIFAQLFHQSFITYSIQQLINDPWFYT